MSPTQARDRVMRMAATDSEAALSLAREIADPWFRSQALAHVARYAPDDRVVQIVDEAIGSSLETDDPYRVVGAAAWAMRALIERGQGQQAAAMIPRLLKRAEGISKSVSRMDALFLLWQAVFPLEDQTCRVVLESLIAAAREARSWKAGRTLQDVSLMVASRDPIEAQRLVQGIPEGKYRLQTARLLDAGQSRLPRAFFW